MEKTTAYHLPPDTELGFVHLRVSSMDRAVAFYREVLGFQMASRTDETVYLSATGEMPPRIVLTESRAASPRPSGTTGLFHLAVRYPSRTELARALTRLSEKGSRVHGFADHGVSEAIYLADPDGNGVELYVDRAQVNWPTVDGELAMTTEALDLNSLMDELVNDHGVWNGLHPGTGIGHVHLQVSDLSRAERFYHGLLGFDVTQRSFPGALFLSAGGYHHHIGLNIWASRGGVPPPPEALGLVSFSLVVSDRLGYEQLAQRIKPETGPVYSYQSVIHTPFLEIRDPDNNTIVIESR